MKLAGHAAPFALAVLLLAAGCGDGGGTRTTDRGEPIDTGGGGGDETDGPVDPGGGDDDAGHDDPMDTSGGSPDADAGGSTDTAPPACDPEVEGSRNIGEPCSKNCQCQTEFCYQGPYLGEFSFCSLNCSGAAGNDCPTGVECLQLGSFKTELDLQYTRICQAKCDRNDVQGVEECKEFAGAYDQCGGTNNQTLWYLEEEDSEATLSLDPTCQIADEVNE